jgi:16S rRNA processing protein RimM
MVTTPPPPDPDDAARDTAGGEELLVVGRLVAPQGLRGELRLLPLSDFPERFTRSGPRWLRPPGEAPRRITLLAGRQLPGRDLYVVRLEQITDRSAAEAVVGAELLVPAGDRPPLAAGEFHLLDLVGLAVHLMPAGAPVRQRPDGPAIGTVRDLLHGGNDLLEVELSGGRRVLIPFVEAIVPEVRPSQGWIGITPPPGLLEL